MAARLLDALEATGNIVYEMMAEELARHAVRTMWDERGGGFFDRAARCGGGVGLLRGGSSRSPPTARRPRAAQRLAATAEQRDFASWPTRTLAAIGPRAAGAGTAGRPLPARRRAAGQ